MTSRNISRRELLPVDGCRGAASAKACASRHGPEDAGYVGTYSTRSMGAAMKGNYLFEMESRTGELSLIDCRRGPQAGMAFPRTIRTIL